MRIPFHPAAVAALCLLSAGLLPVDAMAEPADSQAISGPILAAHNRERTSLGQQPLTWSAALSEQARPWAEALARREVLQHSADRNGAGENLWMGTIDAYSLDEMISAFLSERSDFHAGVFPDIANDKNWSEVGHYTQIIWPQTREVGCALAKGRNFDVLVCRYWPAGNVIGQKVP